MKHREKTKPPNSLRIYWVRIPIVRWGIIGAVCFAVGVVLLPLLTMLLVGSLAAYLHDALLGGADWLYTPLMLFVLTLSLGVAPLWWVALASMHRRKAMRTPRFRSMRLKHLMLHPRVPDRLPHRIVEHAIRSRIFTKRSLHGVLRTIKPGTVVVANGFCRDEFPRPRSNSIPFEPRDLRRDYADLWELMSANVEAQGLCDVGKYAARVYEQPFENDRSKTDETGRPTIIAAGRAALPSVFSASVFVFLFYMFWIGWISIAPLFFIALGVLLLSSLGPLAAFYWERRWWVVPGGLIYREHAFWRRRMRAGRTISNETPLFVDLAGNNGLILGGDQVLSFRFNSWEAGWALVAAWISTARPPTDEEVLAFLGRDAKLPIDLIRS